MTTTTTQTTSLMAQQDEACERFEAASQAYRRACQGTSWTYAAGNPMSYELRVAQQREAAAKRQYEAAYWTAERLDCFRP